MEGETQFRAMIDAIPLLVWSANVDGLTEYHNKQWLDFTGLHLQRALGGGWLEAIHPDDAERLRAVLAAIRQTGKMGEAEARLKRADGEYRWFQMRVVPVSDAADGVQKWYVSHHDIEDRKQAESLLAGKNHILEMMAKGEPLTAILHAMCQLVEEVSCGSLASIMLCDAEGTRLRVGAAPSVPAAFMASLEGAEIGEGQGPCGVAAWRREPVIVTDLNTYADDPVYRERALAHGLQACWSTPILSSEGVIIGTLAIFARRPVCPSARDQKMIEQMTHLASVAVEQSRAQDRLRRSRAYLSEAQKLSLTGSFTWRPSSGDLVWSEATYRIYGYSPDLKPTLEMAKERVHPDDRGTFDATARRAIQEGRDFEFEHRLLFPDGTVKHLSVVARAGRDEAGNLTEFFGAVMDVTAARKSQLSIKQTLESVQALKDQYELAVDTIPGHVWSALPDGWIDFLNKRWRDYTGLTLEQARGWGWSVAIHPEDMPGLESYWKFVLELGKAGETEARLRRFDGEYRWFLFRAVPLHDVHGAVVKWYGQTTDIHDRRQAEMALRESEASLALAQELSSTGSFNWKAQSGVMTWSDETYRICEVDKSVPLSGELARDLIHPDDVVLFREMLSGTGRDFQFECRLRLRKGAIKYLHVVATAVRDGAGKLLEWTGAVRDVTELKNAAEALRASEHLARGQVEALTQTLTALSREAAPEKFLEHVLDTIGRQLGARSLSVWEMSGDSGAISPVGSYEAGILKLATAEEARQRPQVSMEFREHPVWTPFFHSGAHGVLVELDCDPPRARLVNGEPHEWHPCFGDDMEGILALERASQVQAQGIEAALCVPMFIAGRVTGLIGIGFAASRTFRREEIELTRALAHQAMLAIQLIRLSQQGRQAAVTAERNRMARDIHDTLAQGFTGVIVQLEAAADANTRGLSTEADTHLTRAADLARESLREARRSVQALRPQALVDQGLCDALEALFRRMTAGTPLQAQFEVRGPALRLQPAWEENILRIGQEVLTNTLRHASASEFAALLVFGEKEIQMELCDNGRGFNATSRHDGFGLIGIRERVEDMGGTIIIDSVPGVGTMVSIVLPSMKDIGTPAP